MRLVGYTLLHSVSLADIVRLQSRAIMAATRSDTGSRATAMTVSQMSSKTSNSSTTISRTMTRDVVTPVTIVTFVVSTVTGIMLLLHWNAGLVRFSHEWLSVVFSAIALWHLAKNWRAFMGYLKRHAARAAFAGSLIVSVVFTGTTGGGGANPGAVFGALSGARLEAAAPALGLAPDRAVEVLKAANIDAAPGETLTVIGERAGKTGAAIASMLAAKRQR